MVYLIFTADPDGDYEARWEREHQYDTDDIEALIDGVQFWEADHYVEIDLLVDHEAAMAQQDQLDTLRQELAWQRVENGDLPF